MLTVILSQVLRFLSFYVALFLSPRVFAWLLLPHNVSFCYFQLYTCRSFLLCNPFLQYHQCSHTMITCTIDPPLGVLKKVHAVSPVTDVKLSVVAFRYSRPCLCSLDKIYVIRQEKVPTELALIIQSRSFPSPFQQCTIITIHFLVASIAKCNVVYTVRICCISSHLPSSMCHLFFLSAEGQAYCVHISFFMVRFSIRLNPVCVSCRITRQRFAAGLVMRVVCHAYQNKLSNSVDDKLT